jgi:hypothetical protein
MSTFDSKDDLAKFIKERHELLLRAEYDLSNFDYGVVIARRCDVKSRSEEENEKATLQLIHNQIKNLQEYIETPNVFERMKKNGEA